MEKIVGTAGHIDHGKTALVRALTGVDADRLPEEKRRGITIDLGFAEATIGDVHFGFVDVPGHERFIKNMLAGASGIDIMLLVVAATEGVMPQTREHFAICKLLGIERGVIALTKTDLVDEETIELARMDVVELIAGSFLENEPIVHVSSLTGAGIDDLRSALVASVESDETTHEGLVTRLPIDRTFSMKGFGAVVTGTLSAGQIREGDELELLPDSRRVRVRGLQTHGRSAKIVRVGNRAAVNLAGIDHNEIERGMTLASPSIFRPTQAIDVMIELLSDASRPLRSRQRLRFHIGTVEVLGRLQVLTESGEIEPGGSGFVQIRLESPIVAVIGDRFIIRSYSPQITIAGGIILEPFAARHRRRDLSAITSKLDLLSANIGERKGLVELLVETTGATGISLNDISAQMGVDPAWARSVTHELMTTGKAVMVGERYFALAAVSSLSTSAVDAVTRFHKREPLAKGMPREVLRDMVFPHMAEDTFRALLLELVAKGQLAADNEVMCIPQRGQQLDEKETAFVGALSAIYAEAGLDVPKLVDSVNEGQAKSGVSSSDAQKLLRLMVDSQELVKVSDDFYFSTSVIDALIAKIRGFASTSANRSIDVAAFKELAGVSRKYAIPLLEYFDRQKVTVRAGEKRIIL